MKSPTIKMVTPVGTAVTNTARSLQNNELTQSGKKEMNAEGTVPNFTEVQDMNESRVAKKSKKSDPPTNNVQDDSTTKKIGWNDMLHMSIKRFDDNDPTLQHGAIRNRLQHPHVAIAEYDKSGRSACKMCGIIIQPKGVVRITLMMECHSGYRSPCTLHEACFWKHREVAKLKSASEIHIRPSIIDDDPTFKDKLKEKFDAQKIK